MKKFIIVNVLLFTVLCCFGQNVDEPEMIESAVEEDVFMEDFISFQGRKYTIAMMDETTIFMVAKNHLEREIGVVEEHIEDYFENVSTTSRIFSPSWEKGTKLYKIKQINEKNYIAVEWKDNASGNKYYVYCCQKNNEAERQLQKFLKELQK